MSYGGLSRRRGVRQADSVHETSEIPLTLDLDFMYRRGAFQGRSANHTPKLALLELKLPRVDGLEVLQRIKNDERTRLVPVTVLSASCEETDVVESYKLGVDSYIQKLVDFETFRNPPQLGLDWLVVNQIPPSTGLDKGNG